MGLRQGQQGKAQRTERTYQKKQSGSGEDIAQPDQRGYNPSERKAGGTEQCRSRARIGSLAIHGQGRTGSKSEPQSKKQQEEEGFIYDKRATETQCYKLDERQQGHADTTHKHGVLGITEFDRQSGCQPDGQGVDPEEEAEPEGREAIVLLHDEGRRRDIGEEYTHGESHLQDVIDVPAIAQHNAESGQHTFQATAFATLYRQRLPETKIAQQEQYPDAQQYDEDTFPANRVGEESTQDGRGYGSYSVDGSDDGHGFGQLTTGKQVGSDGARHDNSAGAGHSLYQPEEYKALDRAGKDTADGRDNEEQHGGQQRRPTSVPVAQRAEKELTQSQSDHARSESQLDHRRLGVEITDHRRQTGQIHIGDKRSEGRQCP